MLIKRNSQPASNAQRIAALENQYIKLLESKITALTAVKNAPSDNNAVSAQKSTSKSEVFMIPKPIVPKSQIYWS